MQYLGYDPGGKGTHGVAAIQVAASGEISEAPVCAIVEDAKAAWQWLSSHGHVAALGIDTLMAWSLRGSRECDNALRRRYRECAPSVIPQNALYSSMTLNGALIARRAAEIGWPLYESHPKLLVRVMPPHDTAAKSLLHWYTSIKSTHDGTPRQAKRADDMADAVVAAWCAAQGDLDRWSVDLFDIPGDELERLHRAASYPWFEDI